MTLFDRDRIGHGPVRVSDSVRRHVDDAWLYLCLGRHSIGDYGLLDAHDSAVNDASLHAGGRVLSMYPRDPAVPLGGAAHTIYIITEGPPGARQTSIILGDEY